jgi:hypothetical protein
VNTANKKYLIERLKSVVELLRSNRPEMRHMAAAKLLADIAALKTPEEARTIEGFEEWWRNYGSGIRPLPGQDHEEHGRRLAGLAWESATLKERNEI